MNVLLVKTSSLGDIIHTLPALTDAARAIPGIKFAWVAEEGFAEIPTWHANVNQVIPIAWRRWRKNFFATGGVKELKQFYQDLTAQSYDKIIDAQGLLKSAIITRLSKGLRCGLDYRSARETLAALFYQQKYSVLFQQHAVKRMRDLFALALDYPLPTATPDYGIRAHFSQETQQSASAPIVFIHGTTWVGKEWPLAYWQELARYCVNAGLTIEVPWGNAHEKLRAEQIATVSERIKVLPKMNLQALCFTLLRAKCAVAVDTGIGHLAAALDVPTLSLYGPTDPALIGALGRSQVHLRAPVTAAKTRAMQDLSAVQVWQQLKLFAISDKFNLL